MARIRNRFLFLFSTSGILRGESVMSAELSDLLCVENKHAKDSHPYLILCMGIPEGKTTKDNKQYGRAMRHKDVLLCPIGALGFYLLLRFELTREFDRQNCPDFRVNSEWFDIKLLINYGTNHGRSGITPADARKHEIQHQCYIKTIKEIQKEKGIISNHYLHIGRVLGTHRLQYQELLDDHIRQLGNWSTTVRDDCYSTKLPLTPLRAAAGFTDADGMYYSPRTAVEPPESLVKSIFPFAEEQLRLVKEERAEKMADKGGTYMATAVGFLELVIKLRPIILQDAAAIKVLHPQRFDNHPLFESQGHFTGLFQSPEFIVSTIIARYSVLHDIFVLMS